MAQRLNSADESGVVVSGPPLQFDLWLDFDKLSDVELFVGYWHGSTDQDSYLLIGP